MLTMGVIIKNLNIWGILNLYSDGNANSIYTNGITSPRRHFKRSDMDPNMPERLLRP